MTLYGNNINLPKSATINFRDKFKIRHYQKRTLSLSYYVKARLDLVHFGFQQPLQNSIRHTILPEKNGLRPSSKL